MRILYNVFIIALILLVVYYLIKSMTKPSSKRTFTSPTFDKIRREVNKGDLVQDPVSGTYISKEDAVRRVIDGKEFYFANKENADSFTPDKE
jgi:YHS domain-containing protein